MRVVLVGPVARGGNAAPGGVETSFANLVRGLAATGGLDLRLVSFAPGAEEPEEATFEGVPVLHLPGTRRLANVTRHRRERSSLSGVLRDLRPDLVHAQDALRYGYVCLKADQNAPVVVSVHGIIRAELPYASGLRARAQIALAGVALERYCIRHARYLVGPTRYAERFFGGELRGRFWDVGNAIADRFFALDPAPVPGRILYAGSLIPRKRALDLLEALPAVVRAVPHASLRMTAGSGDAAYAAGVLDRSRALGIEDRVTPLAGLTLEELLDEYRRAALVVLPSGEETSPMAIAEAMAARVPVVATRVGGVPDLVDEGETGYLVEVGDVSALGDRIARVLGDPSRGEALGRAGRAKAERSFTTDAVAGRIRAVYDEVTAVRA